MEYGRGDKEGNGAEGLKMGLAVKVRIGFGVGDRDRMGNGVENED